MSNFEELKEYEVEKKRKPLISKNVGIFIMGAGLLASGIICSTRIEPAELEIEDMQKSFINNVCSLSPEFDSELQEYYNKVDDLFVCGDIDEDEKAEMLSTEQIYNKATANKVIYKDFSLVDQKSDIRTKKSMLRDNRIGMYFGLAAGIPMTLGGGGYTLLEAYFKRKLRLSEKEEKEM